MISTLKSPSLTGLIAEERFMRAFLMILTGLFFLTACETIKGVGRDIENAGEAIDDAVD